MLFKNILGNNAVKNLILKEFDSNKVPHGQLFVGPEGSGQLPMALALATYLFCLNRLDGDACGKCNSCAKMVKINHPDLHIFYPTIKTESIEKVSKSKRCFPDFQKIILTNPYVNLSDWNRVLGEGNKSGSIRVRDVVEIINISNLRSYEGNYKLFIIWCANTINEAACNKLLKIIEEPKPNTIFIFIAKDPHTLMPTIRSRLQINVFSKIETPLLLESFKNKYPEIPKTKIEETIARFNNNYGLILNNIKSVETLDLFYEKFVFWMRLCFLSKKKHSTIINQDTKKPISAICQLIDFCNDLSKLSLGEQLSFLKNTVDIFRIVFLNNYNSSINAKWKISIPNFNLSSFSQYVQCDNILDIVLLLNNSHLYLKRYANSKLLFLDLSFSLGKFLTK